MKLIWVIFIVMSQGVWAAPKAELWDFWQPHNEQSSESISHQQWQTVLETFLVVGETQTRFDYAGYQSSGSRAIEEYVLTMSALDPRQYTRDEQFAYWVNLYNALTVQIIVDNYPIASITKLGGFFQFGPWDNDIVTIAGEKLTLNDIEHRVLRPLWKDARIHYAVNCASLGCPDLMPVAYQAENTEQLLEEAAVRFVNSNKGVKLEGNHAQLSSIYDWYSVDFKPDLATHINRYRKGEKLTDQKISYDYDWDLNDR